MEYVRLAARLAARAVLWGTFAALAASVAAQTIAGAALAIFHLTSG